MKISAQSSAKFLAQSAVIAALYVALTWIALPLSFYGIQFRVSEILVLLCFYNRRFIPAMAVGCMLANLLSPIDPLLDMVIGSLATLLAVLPMKSVRNIWIASVFPAITNGLLVGWELNFVFGEPFWLSALQVAAGELAVITCLGVPLYTLLLMKNKHFSALVAKF
jgi:uncharacterized membrane protein